MSVIVGIATSVPAILADTFFTTCPRIDRSNTFLVTPSSAQSRSAYSNSTLCF